MRYKHDGTPALLIPDEPGKIKVHFHDGVNGIAPGQAAVFYEGDDVVGGGWIMKNFRQDKELF